MQVRRVDEGESVVMPLISIEKGGGISVLKSLINGLLISFNPRESQTGVIFLSETQLNEVGYSNSVEQHEKPEFFTESENEEE